MTSPSSLRRAAWASVKPVRRLRRSRSSPGSTGQIYLSRALPVQAGDAGPLKEAMEKPGLMSRAELVRWAVEEKLV